MARPPLEGKVALVTGAGKRIGRSIARKLAAEGANLVVNYLASKEDAEETAHEITLMGARALPWQADVSKREDVLKMFAATDKQFGRLDLLVNNAGIFFPAKFDDLTEEQWDRMQGVNLKAHFLCAQAAAALLRRQKPGRIINITSIGGALAWKNYIHYCVSKAGAIMLTKCLAKALAPDILVNSVAPGTIQFPGEEREEAAARHTPLGRTGTGEDIANAVAFLATAEFITGQIIFVDGGHTLA